MKERRLLTPAVITASAVCGASLLIYIFSRIFPAFAEWWTRYPSQFLRGALAALTNFIPFSVGEMVLLLLIPAAVLYVLVTNKYICEEDGKKYYRALRPLIIIVLVLITAFFGVFGPCYFRHTLDKNLGLQKENVTAQELKFTAEQVVKEINDISVKTDITGATVLPCGYDELVKEIKVSFKDYCQKNEYISWFNSNPKLVSLSPVMTYTHISGVYSFFTGEANINFNYPDFVMPFTIAHEMSHQRGIAREDEANFVAFLVCINSENQYVKYSGLFNMLEYLLSALNKADKNLYKEFVQESITQNIRNELIAYNEFFKKYSDSTASQVVGSINNSYLESQGQQAGSASYGLVVDLAVAYYKTK